MVECRYPVTSTRVGCVSCHSHSRPSPPLVRLSIGVAWCLGGVVQGGEHKGVESKDYRSFMGQGRSFFSMHRFSIIENIFYFIQHKAEMLKYKNKQTKKQLNEEEKERGSGQRR